MKRYPPLALEHCTAAGEALDAEINRQWCKNTGLEIYEGYGQTESILLCCNYKGHQVRPGSMGLPAPGVSLRVITKAGTETDTNEEGDIAVLINNGKTPFVGLFDGYLGDNGELTRPEKTSVINGKTLRWYLTGDKATRDEDGYLWFVGRADDVINSSGYRIGLFVSPYSSLRQLTDARSFRS
jgi:medium-chain acyl-CoA synthetase